MDTKKSPALKHISIVLSYLLHPLFIPLAATLILFFSNTYISYLPSSVKFFDLILIFLNTMLIPLGYMFIFLRTRRIKSLLLESKKERYLPLSLFLVFTFTTYIVLKRVRQPVILYDLFSALTIIIFLTLLITLRWKISLHLVGIGGLSGFLLAASYRLGYDFFLSLWLVSLIVAGFLASARLFLGQHRPAEVYAGFLLGFTVMAGVLLFL